VTTHRFAISNAPEPRGIVSEFQEYLARLERQHPEVERIRDSAKARGDLTTVRNAEALLSEWSAMIATYRPANDGHPPLHRVSSQLPQIWPRAFAAEPVVQRHRSFAFAAASALRRDLGAMWLALLDGRTPWYAKVIAAVACFLAISPIDFTPDVVPHLGYFDDPVLLVLGTVLAARSLSPLLMAELRERASVEHVRALRGSFAISATWLVAALVTSLHLWRPVI